MPAKAPAIIAGLADLGFFPISKSVKAPPHIAIGNG